MSSALSRRDLVDEAARDVRPGSVDDARKLSTLVRECGTAGISRQILVLRLSLLAEGRNRRHHFQLATEALIPLTGVARAQLFHLPNHDHVVAWRGDTPVLRGTLDRLGHLFADDPSLGAEPMDLVTVLRLPEDADLVQHIASESLRPRLPPAAPRRSAGRPLDVPTLAALERAIVQADMSRFARREPICRIGPEGFRLAWERRFLSDSELFETILPDRAPRADRWLFRRLTRTLDRRMLALLGAASELRGVPPLSLDLNVGSLVGPEFLRFDANLPAVLRGQVIINLYAEDILADLAGFCFARDFTATRGYRLLLQDVGPAELALLPPERLGLDLVQVRYRPELSGVALPAGIDPAQVVLGNTDTAGLAWGRARGIALYQGRTVRPSGRGLR